MAATLSGGAKLRAALARIAAALGAASPKKPLLRCGFLEGRKYTVTGTSIPMVAAIQEFGAPNVGIPPRPFFRDMVRKHKGEWAKQVGRALKIQNYDQRRALELMGGVLEGQLRQSIVDTNAPPLSPVTIMLRTMRRRDPNLVVTARTVAQARARVAAGQSTAGTSTKPLVDTGELLNSIASEVVNT